MSNPLRTEKTFKAYEKFKKDGFLADGCNLCKETKSIKEFKYWRIINNMFPYDRVAKTSHIIIPKRHVSYEKLNKIEKKEFELIKLRYINKKYHFTMEAMKNRMSIPAHFHIHLIVLK